MAQYGLENIRNLALLAHNGAGKTSLAEAILFNTKIINRLGKVSEGSTTSDYDPAEQKRGMSISLSMLPYVWQSNKINLMDTPGYPDFVGEVKSAIRVSEGAVVVVCASSGVEVGTEQVWSYCDAVSLPRIVFVNRMDRENVDFLKVVDQIQTKFGRKCLPIQLPIGAHTSFQGVIDLLKMKSYTGTDSQEGDIPQALQSQAQSLREKLVESITETEDSLLEKYLGGEEISQDELNKALRQAVVSGKLVPIMTGSGLQNIGVIPLMDAIVSYLPAPKEREVITIGEGNKPAESAANATGPLAALVFKTSADPYVGKLTYFRVYNGDITSNSQIWNVNRGENERIGQLFVLRGKNQEPAQEIAAGDIGAVAKLAVTATGDTLGAKDKPVKLVPVTFPEPRYSEAVYPKTKLDLDKLGTSLAKIVEEDPTLKMHRDTTTSETILSGLGEIQLGVAAEKMARKFGVNVDLQTPKVPYKETITMQTQAEYKHKKQTGGHGQYGHVVLELVPLPRSSGTEFTERIVGGSIPKNYIPAVEKGVKEGVLEGVLAGYPVEDVRITAIDGSFHPVDSSEICFKIAGAGAVKKGLADGKPVLLEPIVKIKITAPDSYTGDIISDLNTKRGQVHGMNPEDGMNTIEAIVPLAEVQRYAINLKSITQGKGTYSMEFSHYQEAPPLVTQKIIAAKQAEKEKEKV
ncbi:MAG: elongation factor G [Dehalococcoidales bacterium]|nr:elongation factor G [Dehalococcoidales bacterium]